MSLCECGREEEERGEIKRKKKVIKGFVRLSGIYLLVIAKAPKLHASFLRNPYIQSSTPYQLSIPIQAIG